MTSAINTKNAHTLKDPEHPFILVFNKGEDVFETLLQCANLMNIKSAALTGLGALLDPCIAYYRLANKQPEKETFQGIFELISINGNLTQVDGKLYPHIHVALGDEKYRMIGGHLFSAKCAITLELTIIPFAKPIQREMNQDVGINTII